MNGSPSRSRANIDEASMLATAERLARSGLLDAAEAALRELLTQRPRSFAFANALAGLLMQLGREADAAAVLRKCVPGLRDLRERAALFNNLAQALASPAVCDPVEALACCDKALALQADYHDAWINKGNVLRLLNRPAEGMVWYRKALQARPDSPALRWNLAICHLVLGEFKAGWAHYEARWQGHQKHWLRAFPCPQLTSLADLPGKRILLHAEQGYGDSIQMLRFVPLLQAHGADVALELPPALLSLAECLPGVTALVTRDQAKPAVDLHCPLMSLPGVLGISADNIPAKVPYLSVAPDIQASWQARFGPRQRPRIGLSWRGNSTHLNDANRSIPLEKLASLLNLPFDFHCLQLDIGSVDAELVDRLQSHAKSLRSFADTAALISEMDLVISVDTSALHLAGALGKPVWGLLPFCPDYRWLLDRSDSPWYPTMRLFRQPAPRDWNSVVVAVRAALGQTFAV